MFMTQRTKIEKNGQIITDYKKVSIQESLEKGTEFFTISSMHYVVC